MRRLILIVVLVLCALGVRSLSDEAVDVVAGIRSDISGASGLSPASVTADLERTRTRIDALLASARRDDARVDQIRAEAERALARARMRADRAILLAEGHGATRPGTIAALRAEVRKRLAAMRRRVETALPKTPDKT